MGVALDPVTLGCLIGIGQGKVNGRPPGLVGRLLYGLNLNDLGLDVDDHLVVERVASPGLLVQTAERTFRRRLRRRTPMPRPSGFVQIKFPHARFSPAKAGMPTRVGRNIVLPCLGIAVEGLRLLELGELGLRGNAGRRGVDRVLIAIERGRLAGTRRRPAVAAVPARINGAAGPVVVGIGVCRP